MLFVRVPAAAAGSTVGGSRTFEQLSALVAREMRRERRRTLLGSGWFLLHPFLWLAAYSFVFTRLIPMGIEGYASFLLAGLLPWTLFTSGLCQSMGALQLHRPLFRVMVVTPWVFPVAAAIAGAPRLLIATGVLAAWQTLAGTLTASGIPGLLLLAVVQLVLTAGLGALAAYAAALVADAQEAFALVLRVGFFLTPILYPLEKIPQEWTWVARLDPFTGMVSAYRRVLLENQLPLASDLVPALTVGALTLVLAIRLAGPMRSRLAETA